MACYQKKRQVGSDEGVGQSLLSQILVAVRFLTRSQHGLDDEVGFLEIAAAGNDAELPAEGVHEDVVDGGEGQEHGRGVVYDQGNVEVGRPPQVGQLIHHVTVEAVSYTHLRAHETDSYLVCRLLLEK